MPPSSTSSSSSDRRRHGTRFKACELRASVTERVYGFFDKEADNLGRARSWHVGLIVEAFGASVEQMDELERAQLDAILRRPGALLAVLRDGMRSTSTSK